VKNTTALKTHTISLRVEPAIYDWIEGKRDDAKAATGFRPSQSEVIRDLLLTQHRIEQRRGPSQAERMRNLRAKRNGKGASA